MRTHRRGTTVVVALVLLGGAAGPAVLRSDPAAAVACPVSAPDERAAARLAAECGGPVEIGAARTEFTQVFAEPSGNRTLHQSVVPVRARRADGTWAAVDTALRPDGASYVPGAISADLRLSAGGTAPLATLRLSGRTFTLSWPSALPAPTVSGDAATYPEVLPGVDLVVRAVVGGFAHVLVVKTRAAAANPAVRQIRYRLGGDVQVSVTPEGGLRVMSGRTLLAQAAGATMWDSTGSAAALSTPAAPAETARQAPVAVAVAGTDLVLTPDAGLLSASEAVYPLFIDPHFQAGRNRFAYANSSNRNWTLNDSTLAAGDPRSAAPQAWVGKDPVNALTYRGFLQFPTNASGHNLAGKRITGASLRGRVDHTWKCGANRPTYFYRTAGISASPRQTWPGPALQVALGSVSVHANETSCGEGNAAFELGGTALRNDLQAAANARWGTYTVGLSAGQTTGGTNEGTQDRWARFFLNDFVLVVSYNSPPGKPANLSTSAVACGGVVGTAMPTLRAQFVDPDGSDSLRSTYEWRQLPSGAVVAGAGPSRPANNYGELTVALPDSEGRGYAWRVQTRDATDVSVWSDWCAFTVNASAPPAPIVTSSSHPADGAAHGGPGEPGTFAFGQPAGDPRGRDVVAYVYGWSNPPNTRLTVAAGAASPALTLVPPRYGLNTLYVHGVDTAGTPGPTTVYQFLVGAPAAPLAHWPLDTLGGRRFADLVGGATLTPDGDVTWTPDNRLVGESTVTFGRTGGSGAASARVALDTSGSFSVAAWVRLTDDTDYRAAVSKEGTAVSTFRLGYRDDLDAWCFTLRGRDDPNGLLTHACGPRPVVGRWTHLVGVYEDAGARLRLYVDGGLAANVGFTSAFDVEWNGGWTTPGPVTIGRARNAANTASGGLTDPFVGDVTDVRVWNRVVVPDDIVGTSADEATQTPATAGLLAPVEVGSWNFNGGVDCACGDATDGTFWGRRLYLDGWDATPPRTSFTGESHDDNGALRLGGSGHASTTNPVDGTARPVVRTDQSFTVSAWVHLTDASRNRIAVTQDGAAESAFALRFDHSAGDRWSFAVALTDSATTARGVAMAPAATTELNAWVHLVGVYDAATNQIRLYVNGAQAASATLAGRPFFASSSLQVGRGRWGGVVNDPWLGVIDQVKAHAGAMSAREVAALYAAG